MPALIATADRNFVAGWFADHQHLHAGGCLLADDCSDGHLCRAAYVAARE
jgi:hypothetical protein